MQNMIANLKKKISSKNQGTYFLFMDNMDDCSERDPFQLDFHEKKIDSNFFSSLNQFIRPSRVRR